MRRHTLLSRLFLLVVLALLPAVTIQGYNEFELRRVRQVEVEDHALSLAKLAAADQQQIIQGIRQVLIALSELPAIQAKDGAACDAYLTTMQRRFPAFLTFIATDLTGQSFCTSDLKPVSIAARPYFINALTTGAFTVGEFSVGLSTRRKVIQFALPFKVDGGRPGGVIVASLGLRWLADYVGRKGVPEGAALAITDRNNTYLARYPDNNRFVGQKMPREQALHLAQPGTADISDVDGMQRLIGYSPLAGSGGLHVSFGLDKARAFAAIQHRTQRDILLIVLGTALVLVLTWLGARRFLHRPLGQLVDAANQWQLGDYGRRVDNQENSEIGRVADAFNTMAEGLARRELELSEAKAKAEEAANRIATIFASTTDSVLVVGRDWRLCYLNERAKMQIAEGRDLVGMDLREVFSDAGDTSIVTRLQEAMSDQRPTSFEGFCPRRGTWFELNAFPSDQGLTIYLRNITEHKDAVEAQRRMEEKLHQSQKMEAVGQLTGGIAHDFNNLLTIVSGNLERIDDCADNDRVRRLAAVARHATDRGAQLTAQLLAFSRRQELNPRPVGANQLISEFQGLIRQALGEGCEVKLMTAARLWPCHVDPAQLQTALLNLALNGRDAMPDGGVLTIETRNDVLAEGTVAGCPPGPYVRLSVSDTGRGMPPDVRDRAFEPFFTTKEVGKGTGLGLSMVYGFVRQSGGQVTIDSTLGAGTTINLYLPRATQLPDAEMAAIQSQAVPAGSERLLVVEDNAMLLEVTSDMLTDLGYRVVSARNSAEAVAMIRNGQQFDLLFSDVAMPDGMNGIELARKVRRRNKDIKILLTSGYAEDALARHGAADEFPVIGKPFRRADLAQRLRSILESDT